VSGRRNKNLTNENIIEIVKMYDARWKHHNNQFWSVLIKLSLISYTIILFPFLYDLFGVALDEINLTPVVFPLLGGMLSFLFFVINVSNAGRQWGMKKTIGNILTLYNLDSLREVDFKVDSTEGLHMPWLQKRVLSKIISYGNLIIQVLLSVGVIVLLLARQVD